MTQDPLDKGIGAENKKQVVNVTIIREDAESTLNSAAGKADAINIYRMQEGNIANATALDLSL